MNDIDLSKLTIKENPTKVIRANFDGTEKDFTISALSDTEQNDFNHILHNSNDVFRHRNMQNGAIAHLQRPARCSAPPRRPFRHRTAVP